MPMSRRCIPYTPRRRELRDSAFALISTAGVQLREQEPYNLDGDNSWRLIPGDVRTDQLMVTHGHYDHRHADDDETNSVAVSDVAWTSAKASSLKI
ncbi:MAG TPA: hypothetical protein VF916_03040 [Ktedonobacterales bacterium]